MAVPFSRPAYPGSRRRSQQQREQQSQQRVQRPQTSITRFLDGQGGIRLDQLSLTSRIAFYALYEAYRLLMDLTNGQTQQQPRNLQSTQETVPHTVLNGGTQQEESQPSPAYVYTNPLPDIVESTQFAEARGFENDKCLSAAQPDLVQDTINTHESNEDETDRAYVVPDVVPRLQDCQYQPREFVFKTNQEYKSQRSVSISSDYYSLDGLSNADDEEDYESLNDRLDQDLDDKYLIQKATPWSNLGRQLTEIASAFEVTYATPVSQHHRELYEVYRELKSKTLQQSRTDLSMSGLAKTVLRQVLLSSIWILLKKIT